VPVAPLSPAVTRRTRRAISSRGWERSSRKELERKYVPWVMADGKHIGCRFCGAGAYAEVTCPASLCTFAPEANEPAHPYKYYWEPLCWDTSAHILGCKADGIHEECRFCGGGEYTSIPCPATGASR